MSNNTTCGNIPQHRETVGVPHHVYTQHTQPIQQMWTDHQVSIDRIPVSQETRAMTHPTRNVCLNGDRDCDRREIVRDCDRERCDGYGSRGYGYGPYRPRNQGYYY